VARELKVTEIGDLPDLVRLAEEVHDTGEPRLLRRAGEDLALLTPVLPAVKSRRGRKKTQADYDAFRAAAGSWKDVDTDKLLEEIYESRRLSSRPPVEL
jgi:hypothetical protein